MCNRLDISSFRLLAPEGGEFDWATTTTGAAVFGASRGGEGCFLALAYDGSG